MWRELTRGLCSDCEFYPPASFSEIASVEQSLKVALPKDLKDLLTESNGIHGEYGLHLIWSTEEIQETNLLLRTPRFAQDYMPLDSLLFFADAGNGEKFAFGIIEGRIKCPFIYSWNPIDDSRTWRAPSLKLYLEWWQQGKLSV
ncbi:MAG TPA: SMI1/KNR4 family protein [Ktedonobacteraceae bacterium]